MSLVFGNSEMKRPFSIRLVGWVLVMVLTAAAHGLGQSSQEAGFGQGSERVVNAKGYASVDAVRPGDKFKIAVVLEVAPGYHINSHVPTLDYLVATEARFDGVDSIRIGDVKYPAPEQRAFGFAPDTELAVHEGSVIITAEAEALKSLKPNPISIPVSVTVQSCNDALCLAPAVLKLDIALAGVAPGEPVQQVNAELFVRATAAQTEAKRSIADLKQFGNAAKRDDLAELISSKGLMVALISVFLGGLVLNATPCVYPIIPITIGFFVNQSSSGAPRLKRTSSMAAMYVIGMAITYSILGVVASMTGGLFGAALQSPWVLVGLALLMVALSLSMFGVYEFRMPQFVNRLANQSTQSTTGMIGALVMGLTMGIVAAPCIGPFVLGLLVHVSTKGDPVYGFFLFFVLALGLGLPYLILGTFSGTIKALPRSGEWMVTVRKVFGLVLIGMALYFLIPLMGALTNYVLVAFFGISALYLILWESSRAKPKQFGWVLRAIGLGSAVIAVIVALPKGAEAGISWQPYSQQALELARKEGKAIIVDTYAEWCLPCKELDQITFTDPEVRKLAESFVTLKLDLTRNDPESEAGRARSRFNILGVPTVIFLDAAGRERAELRLEGFEKPAAFLMRMQQLATSTANENGSLQSDGRSEDTSSASAEYAPALTLNILDGGKLDLVSLKGKVVLVDFWATWCVPCLSEIPMFNEFQKTYKSSGFELVAVSLDEEGIEIVEPFVKTHPMNYTIAVGDASVAQHFDVSDSVLPVAFLIDRTGQIRFKHVGVTPNAREVFESEIKKLLKE